MLGGCAMSIWKITEDGPKKIPETKFKKENVLEKELEDWIIAQPSLLGEPLLIIGRQVLIPDVRDKLDILALDPKGKAVIIEIKRGKLKDPVDMQALRYASYISKWSFEEFENQARKFLNNNESKKFNFNEVFESFCEESNIDEIHDINNDQRMIIVGSEVKEKLGSVALWLHEHNIDIKIVEIEAYKEGKSILLQPSVIVPLPVSKFAETGRAPQGEGSQPWISDGRTWHLEKRCSDQTKDMLLEIDGIIRENFDVVGPSWNQKFYVSYKMNNYNWLSIHTHPSTLILCFLTKAGSFNQSILAKQLNVEVYNIDDSKSVKLSLPSSITITNRNDSTDRVVLRIKSDFSFLNIDGFIDFLDEMYKAFPK